MCYWDLSHIRDQRIVMVRTTHKDRYAISAETLRLGSLLDGLQCNSFENSRGEVIPWTAKDYLREVDEFIKHVVEWKVEYLVDEDEIGGKDLEELRTMLYGLVRDCFVALGEVEGVVDVH